MRREQSYHVMWMAPAESAYARVRLSALSKISSLEQLRVVDHDSAWTLVWTKTRVWSYRRHRDSFDRFENDRDNSEERNHTSRRAGFHVSRSGARALIPLHIDGSGQGAQNVGSRFFSFALKRSAEAPRGRRLQSNRMCFGRSRRTKWI